MTYLPKPSEQRKRKPRNHVMRNRTRSKAAMIRDLDKAVRNEIVVARDNNTCQVCGAKEGDWDEQLQRFVVIQWCHVHTRRWLCVRWSEDNSFAGCDKCHKSFDMNKVLGFDWYMKTFPDRWERLKNYLQFGDTQMKDSAVRSLWLERVRGVEPQ